MAQQVFINLQPFWLETCCRCQTQFAMDGTAHKIALERRENFSFCCPHGHSQSYTTGETALEKMRRERNQLKQNQAYLYDRIDVEIRRASAYKGHVTKLKNRINAGICPCCNRHFMNLQRHMEGRHPNFKKENIINA